MFFINNVHQPFEQTRLLMDVFERDGNTQIKNVNIVSKSKYPNISKGYLYSSSRASLNHFALRMISDKKCRIIDINAGLLNSDLPSLTYQELVDVIMWCIEQPNHIEIGEISVWHKTPYKEISMLKDKMN